MRPIAILLSLGIAMSAAGDDQMCGTSDENTVRVQALHERSRQQRLRIAPNATSTPVAALRDGIFAVTANDATAIGGRLNDLAGRSIVLTPRAGNRFAVAATELKYVPTPDTPLRKFSQTPTEPTLEYDLSAFQFPWFGSNVTKLYVTAYNTIHLTLPVLSGAPQFDALEAAAQRDALLSPLAFTERRPKNLPAPDLFVTESAESLVFTWRSSAGQFFGYDVQAELRKDGTIVYSWRSLRAIDWGTPVATNGFDSWKPAERVLATFTDATGEVPTTAAGVLAPMLDLASVQVTRLNESEIIRLRLKVATALDAQKIEEGRSVVYRVQLGANTSELRVMGGGTTWVYAPGRTALQKNGATARADGNTIDFFVAQSGLTLPADGNTTVRVTTFLGNGTLVDSYNGPITVEQPSRTFLTDLSAANGQEISLPIAESFVLPEFDPFAVWDQLQQQYAIPNDQIDAVAFYQSFYTDMIFYAGAYSTVGNSQALGIGNYNSTISGPSRSKTPALLHMNHLTYGYNAAEKSASQVALHEFGHRWLYFAPIRENQTNSLILNPAGAHPAKYVHMPAAFKVYDDDESSTMGGAFYTQQGDGSWKARVKNHGYSWVELYLMGLASRAEVAPWFYLANTNPKLEGEYWPEDNTVVTGERKQVTIDQIVTANGERVPGVAVSPRAFRVLFVLVTPNGQTATDAQIAQMNATRTVFEKNFHKATGGRGTVSTEWVTVPKRRVVR